MILVNNQLDAQFFMYAGAYAPAYQTVIHTELHKPDVALIQ